jgi:hypothetical protein
MLAKTEDLVRRPALVVPLEIGDPIRKLADEAEREGAVDEGVDAGVGDGPPLAPFKRCLQPLEIFRP